METYRMINRELSLHNQELRNALSKLKREVTYLNEQLFEQREQFNRMKDSIANTLEEKFKETMMLIYPERVTRIKFSALSVVSHRRSNDNVTIADSLRNQMYSPPAKSTVEEPEGNNKRKSSEKSFGKLTDSESQCNESEEQTLLQSTGESCNSSVVLNASRRSLDYSIPTINEETVSDATINNLLDAPCSTPYNPNKSECMETNVFPCTSPFEKKVRVLVPKISAEKMELLTINTKNKSIRDNPKKKTNQRLSKGKKSIKRSKGDSKENISNKSENTYSDDESAMSTTMGKSLRPKNKAVNFKEPSLRQKLRNTTNVKIK